MIQKYVLTNKTKGNSEKQIYDIPFCLIVYDVIMKHWDFFIR